MHHVDLRCFIAALKRIHITQRPTVAPEPPDRFEFTFGRLLALAPHPIGIEDLVEQFIDKIFNH